MAIMQQIYKAYSSEDEDAYKCLSCKYVTVRPHKYCSNCGEKVTVRRHGLMPKKNAKERIYVGRREEPTDYYVLWDWFSKGEFSVAYQFYRCYRNKGSGEKVTSSARLIFEQLKELREEGHGNFQVARLSTEELANYRIAGERIAPIRLLVLI